ncbi:sulfatase-like hydrolase/transferase [Draconibacterium sp.]|uniref:sulfatase-like hydrolase/transferase n=1 Tax=Draconibacterium sp. TaxID=1965318 RepID=UPI00356A9D4F
MIRNMLILLISFGFLISCQKPIERPNIILIYVDDMGMGDASFTRGEVRPTPNIDKMASEGKVFTQYYTNAPVCSPSRVAVTTGNYPQRWNINTFLSSKEHNKKCDQLDYLKAEAPSLARTLKTAGYTTAHFGKWHMGGGRDVTEAPVISKYGFDEFVSTWESPNPDSLLTSSNWIWAPTDSIKRWDRTAYFVEKTLDFLKKNEDKPCYINLWPDDVHSPWVASEQYQDGQSNPNYYSLEYLKPVIDVFDRDMGHLMDGLKELGLDENTLIVFTSDNGPAPTFEYSRTNGLRGLKNSLYEGGINMPFFVRWPEKIKAGQTDSESVIAAIDLFPTLCKIGGAELPQSYCSDGVDVSKAFVSEKETIQKRKIFWEYGRRNTKISLPKAAYDKSPALAVRYGDWKCFTSFDGEKLELYNLKNDPNERTNIAAQSEELANQLKAEMLDWFEKTDKSEVRN